MKNVLTSNTEYARQLFWNCRGLLAFLGIVIHSAGIYAPKYLPLSDPQNYLFFRYVQDAIHAFRMEAFFILSGCAAYIVSRKKTNNFLLNRTVRLFIPFVTIALLLNWPIFQLVKWQIGKPPEGNLSANFFDVQFWLAGDWVLHPTSGS